MIIAISSILILMLLGYVFRKNAFPSKDFWSHSERLSYYVLFPAFLIHRLSDLKASTEYIIDVMFVIFLFLSLLMLISLFISKKLKLIHPTWTSLVQGNIRFNTFIALAFAQSLLSDSGLAITILTAGLMIIQVNIYTVIAFEGIKDLKKLVFSLIKNPFIIACVLGLGINMSGLSLPVLVDQSLALLGRCALPLSILAVGSALKMQALSHNGLVTLSSSAVKLLLAPLLMWLLCWIFNISAEFSLSLMILSTMPTASSAYIFAKNMGGDADTMASIFTFQTLMSVLTITVILKIYGL